MMFTNELLRQRSSRTFGKYGDLCPDIDTRLVIALSITISVDALIPGADSSDAVSVH